MVSVNLELTSVSDPAITGKVTMEIPENEVLVMRAYHKNCEALEETSLIKNWKVGTFSITANPTGVHITGQSVPYASLAEYLHVGRRFFLFEEPSSFSKTASLFGKRGQGTLLAKQIKTVREQYETGDLGRYMQITIDGLPLLSDQAIKMWLNGVEYHQDTDKAKIVEGLEAALGQSGLKAVFVEYLIGRTKAIFKLDELVALVLKKADAN